MVMNCKGVHMCLNFFKLGFTSQKAWVTKKKNTDEKHNLDLKSFRF